MKHYINNTALLFERITKASDAILKAKQLDGRYKDRNGTVRTVNHIRYDMRKLGEEHDKRRENFIYQAEKLNADPTLLPGNFLSSQQLLERYGQRYKRYKIEGVWFREERYPGNYLTPHILNRLTRQWMRVNTIAYQPGARCFYNNRFCDSVLEYQRKVIMNGNFRDVNFMVENWDRPLIYQYDPDRECLDLEDFTKLLNEWKKYDHNTIKQIDKLSVEENKADRGDFMIGNESPYGSLYQEGNSIIFEVASKRFWAYVDFLYELSEQHSGYFGKGATHIMDGLYKHFRGELYGKGRKIGLNNFKLRATREFLLFSDEHKQLRLDLYRQIDPPNKTSDEVFTGGLFHIFDHFKGLRASTINRGDFQFQEQSVFMILRDLFFNHTVLMTNKASGDQMFQAVYAYETPLYIDDEKKWVLKLKNWKGIFYFNHAQNLFYLTSLHIK